MPNSDEDDEEDKWPEELNDQLDLRKRRAVRGVRPSCVLNHRLNKTILFCEVQICPPCSSCGM